MAHLNKSVLGKVSGTVGDITFRQRGGKNVISLRPKSFIPGDDAASEERRAKFAFSARLAQAMNGVPVLRTLWEADTPPGISPYNYMIAVNFKLVNADSPTSLTTIIPSMGFPAKATTISIDSNAVAIEMQPLGTAAGVDPNVEKTVQLVAVLHLFKPLNATLDETRCVALISPEQAVVTDAAMIFTIKPGSMESQLIAAYQENKALMAIITLDADKNVVQASNTFQSE